MSCFLEALHSGRVLLMDGAMGTELQRPGIPNGERYDLCTLTHPGRVRAIHQAYADAGAEVLLTNTFQVVPSAIGWRSRPPFPHASYDERRALVALQWSACALARSACGPEGFVLADLGSFMVRSTSQEFSDLSMLQAAVKHLGPVDGLVLETCSTPRVRQAVRKAVGLAAGLPVLLSMTYQRTESGRIETISGHSPEWFAERLPADGIAALGVNCGRDVGMEEMIEVIQRYRQATDLPLFARPNAGTPRLAGKRLVYPRTAEKLARRLPELLEAGVRMVGGCCGTTPAHIAAFRPTLDAWNRRHSNPKR